MYVQSRAHELCLGIWDCMSNQEVVDFVHEGVAKDKTLEKICEEMMDNCLADSETSTGLGYDNMSVMVIGILNGKTEKEWYEAIKAKNQATATPTPAATKTASNPTEVVKETTPPPTK